MKMVIVSVIINSQNGEKSYDLEIPCHVPVGILCRQIGNALYDYSGLKLSDDITLFSTRLRRTLHKEETFDSAGIRNGDIIKIN